VGRLIDRKGVDLLLRALAGLDMPWRLDVVGDGPRRAALEQQARTGGLGDRVTFHGARPPEEIPNWCRGADLFIGPSREEPLGLVFLEAAACGCPVVATRSGGIPEILADGESALLVPPEDVDGLRATIRRALTDEALRRRLIDGGLSAAHGNSLDRSIDRTLVVYHRVLSS
jgi:colanic acid/amylovoran biosynthesis glycosyltransferase